jgi:predicted nucleotidyltransferase
VSKSRSSDVPKRFRDRDIFRDNHERIFITLGYIQPTDRVLSYLKYIPDTDGTWEVDGKGYKRTFWGTVDSTVDGMSLLPSDYIVLDTHFQTELVEPPREVIKDYFNPEERLREILDEPKDSLELLAQKAAVTLHDELQIPFETLGISGSILWRGHNPEFSDINMNIYGFQESWYLQENYTTLENEAAHTRLRNLPEWNRAIERVSNRLPILSLDDLQSLFSHRKALCIDNRCIGITPILQSEQIPIKHGSESYTTLSQEPITLRTTIEDCTHGIFHPAIYRISPKSVDGFSVTRILVYDGAFCGLFTNGDQIEVSGTLQRVTVTDSSDEFHQLMVGTKDGSGKEYIRFLS